MDTSTLLLTAIHAWDIDKFQRITEFRVRRFCVPGARVVSRTGDGFLYPLVPLLAQPVGASVQWVFVYLLAAFVIERSIYLAKKNCLRRKRPAAALRRACGLVVPSDEFSFPSGHTSAAFLAVTVLVLTLGPGFAVLYVWSAMVGMWRIVLGVHFPSDIIAGAVLGATVAALVVTYVPF